MQLSVRALGDPLGVPTSRSDLASLTSRHRPRSRAQGGVRSVLVISSSSMLTKKTDAARVALPAGAPAQLVVERGGPVPAGADDVEPAELDDLVPRRPSRPPRRMSVPRPGHLRRDGDRAAGAGLGDDRRFLGVVLGVQHDAAQAGGGEPVGQPLRLGHVERADQDRPPGLVHLGDLGDDRVPSASAVAYSRSGSSSRTHGRLGGTTATSRLVELAQLLADGTAVAVMPHTFG